MIRLVDENDYYKGHLELYQQLTSIKPELISYDDYKEFIFNLNNKHKIYVIEIDNKIVASCTLLIENKLIHNLSNVAHIEDVVVDNNYRNRGLCRSLLKYIIDDVNENYNCYKIILDCSDDNVIIYEKIGFIKRGNQMSIYL